MGHNEHKWENLMTIILKNLVLSSVMISLGTLTAMADPSGMWKRSAANGGTLIQIAKCGGSFCTTVRSGEFNGQRSGKFAKSGDGYAGEITDLKKKKTYTGTLALQGATKLKMTGCALKIFCKSEVWTKQ